ncbi:MAG: hypothetical protein R2911_39980 [Caldilineaceae bacterium]
MQFDALPYIEKNVRLADPVATTGDRVYAICSQNGLFPDPWARDHVPHEMEGVWNHPIKLLDGFELAIRNVQSGVITWLREADACRVFGCCTEFDYRVGPLHVARRDWAPDGVEGMFVELAVSAPADFNKSLVLIMLAHSDLRPAWLGAEAGMVDGADRLEIERDLGAARFVDAQNPWAVLVGGECAASSIEPAPSNAQPPAHIGNGAAAALLTWSLEPHTDTVLIIAGSAQSTTSARQTFAQMQQNRPALGRPKWRYGEMVRHRTPAFAGCADRCGLYWTKLNCQMLARTTAEYGPAVGAGLPSYPWWFGIDAAYAVLPLVQSGQFELAKSTLRLLKLVSERHNAGEPGRVIHEMSTTGLVYNAGNLVETPAFTRAVHDVWRWSGDAAFLAEMYPFCKAGLLDYTLAQCDADGDGYPAGRSIIETLEMHAGFECVDVAAYTWDALNRLAAMAQAVGDAEPIAQMRAQAERLLTGLRTDWWLEDEGLFADVRASVSEVQTALGKIAELGAQHPTETDLQRQVANAHALFAPGLATYADTDSSVDRPWLLRHWVTLCPAEVGAATPAQATRLLARLGSAEFSNEWGMFLHPDRHDVMSINSGLLALTAARYGRIEEALRLVRQQAQTLGQHMPGAISEALPDQWCFLQLWSALGIVSPVVEGILGIAPRADERVLRVVPQLPPGWDHAEVRRVRVGDAYFDIQVEQSAHQIEVTVKCDEADYRIEIGCIIPDGSAPQSVWLNTQEVNYELEPTLRGQCVVCKVMGSATLTVRF